MIDRELNEYIARFYRNNNKALLLTGARQTGKTFALRQEGKKYASYLEVNFVENPQAAELVKNATGTKDLLLRLSTLAAKPLVPGNTFVFFDEVQKCPEIVTAIKFLVDDGRFKYGLSGSLLGVELHDLRSEPVGYMDVKDVYPLSLTEFLRAVGVSEEIIDELRACWEAKRPVDDFVHQRIMKLFRLYLLIGGMPAVVKKYLDTNDLQEVSAEQHAILRLYRRDIAQYDPDNKLYLDEILELIPSELNDKNKRFILKNLKEKAKFARFAADFLWLKNAGVALPTYNVEEPKAPLILSKCRNLFKLFQNDVGLLACQYADGLVGKILNGDKGVNFGGIFENFVAQELQHSDFKLYYFNSKRQGEVDFLIENDGKVLPIEVKSGKDYSRHQALNNILNDPNYGIDEAVVLHNDNLKAVGNVWYAPIYMVAFMQRCRPEKLIYKPDLTGLTTH